VTDDEIYSALNSRLVVLYILPEVGSTSVGDDDKLHLLNLVSGITLDSPDTTSASGGAFGASASTAGEFDNSLSVAGAFSGTESGTVRFATSKSASGAYSASITL
jgi:hypothetical protein